MRAEETQVPCVEEAWVRFVASLAANRDLGRACAEADVLVAEYQRRLRGEKVAVSSV